MGNLVHLLILDLMKTLKISSVILVSLLAVQCNDRSNRELLSKPGLWAEEIEVKREGMSFDDLVFVVEGGGMEAYLLNKFGKKEFTWEFDSRFGNELQLLPDGNVIGVFKAEDASLKVAGGYGGVIRTIAPDGQIVWEYVYNHQNYLSHHDLEVLDNGNVLFLAWERITPAEAGESGVDTRVDIFPEKLVEVNPATDEIVWEWRSWNHIVQEVYQDKPTYGKILDNPHKIDIYYAPNKKGDIMHANGLAVDQSRDLVYISVNHYDEIWVIDRSTTTQEAAGSTGGKYGKGGDLVYRFGNPGAYKNSRGEKIFDRLHFPNLIREGYPGAGNMLVFVNGESAGQSTVYELELPETLSLQPNYDNEPEIVWSYTDSTLFYGRISGADRIENGNTLICEGDYGFWEVTPDKEVVWKYKWQGTSYWRGYVFGPEDNAIVNLWQRAGLERD